MEGLGKSLIPYINSPLSGSPIPNNSSLFVARYFWVTGESDKAITEYQKIIPKLSKSDSVLVELELRKLILFSKSIQGRILASVIYYCWTLPEKLYGLAFLFFLLFISLSIYLKIKKTPKFVIQNFYDYSNLNIGTNLPQLAVDRIHEIVWRARKLKEMNSVIVDSLEIPALDLMSEGDNQSVAELLEIAVTFFAYN